MESDEDTVDAALRAQAGEATAVPWRVGAELEVCDPRLERLVGFGGGVGRRRADQAAVLVREPHH
ncbi:hypothetical protein E1287_25655 [Actinomadura sp. KC06]|uniref:hypothetical protein n=1 Tax=Actinomadura sp. KC06 TaxID=2530369 RepID=UPI0010506C2A|nr:hypothetical protein [Actinomadura sp. KC06]TDD31649.1 hypothetical protein E1287_25655 [Actinomadura sp. KC06]